MSFFSNAVRLIRRKKDSQDTRDTFDVSDSLPKISEDKSADSVDSARIGSKTTATSPSVSFGWIDDLDDAPVQTTFKPIIRSEAYSTHINNKHFTPTLTKDLTGNLKKETSVSNVSDRASCSLSDSKKMQNLSLESSQLISKNNFGTKDIAKTSHTLVEMKPGSPLNEIHGNQEHQPQTQEEAQTAIQDGDATNIELGFSLRNYAKESFSVMIVRPISNCMHKILRASYFAITGVLVGGLVALIACLVALQFGSVENSIISAYLIDKIDMILPNSDISVKSAMLQWNSEAGSVEICLNKVKFEDFFIPKVTVLPNYTESFKNWKFVADAVSIVEPKISLHVADDFKTVFIDPNLIKTRLHKPVLEPFSTIINIKDGFLGKGVINKDVTFKVINADVSVLENGQTWDAQNLFCEYKLGDQFPKVLYFRSVLPRQKYASSIRATRFSNDLGYEIKINSLNPAVLYDAFIERKTPVEKLLPFIQGYNLPISGDAKIFLNPDQSFKNCSFNILASKGIIRLPNRNSLALNLGKKVDNANISGSIFKDKMNFNSINISYGNSGVQLTGLSIPINNSDLLDTANIDGTFSLTNVNLDEVYGILPQGMSKPILAIFRNYMPGFRLALLKFDLNGPISFVESNAHSNTVDTNKDNLSVSQGVFKIHGAQIPITKDLVATDVDATGTVKQDGFDVKVSGAKLGKSKINNGVFFISNDQSWIGKVNVSLPTDELKKYAADLNLENLPFKNLEINGNAQIDLKLVRLTKDQFAENALPFRITEESGVICSDDSSKKLSFFWNKNKSSAIADVINGKHSTHLEITEDTVQKIGSSKLHCVGNSGFLDDVIPFISKGLKGDFDLTLNKAWDKSGECSDISINLANATLKLPVLGQVKGPQESGKFSAHIQKHPDKITVSQMILETPKAKISGNITANNDWNITECVLDDISTNGISARANIFKKDHEKLILSLVGDSFDIHKLAELVNQADKDVRLVTYLNMKNLQFNGNTLKNIKGTIDILNGRIVDGSCIGVLEDSTLVLDTKPLEGSNDHIVSISSSDAEKFLKTFGIGTSIDGGTISFSMKSSDIAKGVISGNFEMNNFLVKNNMQLMRLITLSSPNYMNGMHVIIGFNTCSGHLNLAEGKLIIENLRAVSPTIAIALNGEYDRVSDELNASGIILPISSLGSMNSGGCSAADFAMTGSFWNPNLSVSALKVIDLEDLQNVFGNSVPQLYGTAASSTGSNNLFLEKSETIQPALEEEFSTVKVLRGTPEPTMNAPKVKDPYTIKAFDRAAAAIEEEKRQLLRYNMKHRNFYTKNKEKEIKNNFGVKINRGKSRRNKKNHK